MPTSATGGYLLPVHTGTAGIPAPVEDIALDRQLNDLVSGITGLAGNMVFPRWQPDPPQIPAHTTNWAAIGVTQEESRSTGTPFIRHVGCDPWDDPTPADNAYEGHDELEDEELITMLVSFYGPDSKKFAKIFSRGVHVAQNWEEARSRGFKLYDIGPLRFVPELINGQWFRRSDVQVRMTREIAHSYGVLNIVQAAGTITGNDQGTRVVTQTFDTENVE